MNNNCIEFHLNGNKNDWDKMYDSVHSSPIKPTPSNHRRGYWVGCYFMSCRSKNPCAWDTFYFYVGTIAHLRDTYTHASWKRFKYCQSKIKRLVFVQWQHVLYRYRTQNPSSQPAKHLVFDYRRQLIAKSADLLTFLIKKWRSTCFAFFDFFRQTQSIL